MFLICSVLFVQSHNCWKSAQNLVLAVLVVFFLVLQVKRKVLPCRQNGGGWVKKRSFDAVCLFVQDYSLSVVGCSVVRAPSSVFRCSLCIHPVVRSLVRLAGLGVRRASVVRLFVLAGWPGCSLAR